MRTNQDILDISNALRATPNPRAWFDDPTGAAGSFHDWYEWNHLTAYANPPYQGRRTATQGTDKRFGSMLFLDTLAGANLVWEAVRGHAILPTSGVTSTFAFPWFFSMRMNRSNPVGSDLGEKYQGISWGDHYDVNTPWQTGAITSSSQGKVSLHYNYTLNLWQVQIFAPGDPTVAPDNYTCNPQVPFAVDSNLPELALMWVPPYDILTGGLGVGARLVAMINGQVVFDRRDDPRFGNLMGTLTNGPGIFWTNGSNASSRASEAGYYQGRIWAPLAMSPQV